LGRDLALRLTQASGKAEIAKRYLIPRQLEEAGVADGKGPPVFQPDAVRSLTTGYTRESGVRQLEREIGAIARKLARRIAGGQPAPDAITPESIRELLGRPRVHPEHAEENSEIGVATGIYYTPMGGDIMFVEASIRRLWRPLPANGVSQVAGWGDVSMILTGQVADLLAGSLPAWVPYGD
jgi:ATP-dependent Lon protease